MKIKLNEITKKLEQGIITENEAESLLLGLLDTTKRFSFTELRNVLRKPKLVLIRENLKNILMEWSGHHYDTKEDIYFIEKYRGKKVMVYEWCGDWWICEDDNYPISEKCFSLI